MRILALCCLAALAACSGNPAAYDQFVACTAAGGQPLVIQTVAPCAGLEDVTRVENFALGPTGGFTYGAETNTVMTENQDGVAERLRRQWLAEALRVRRLCPNGYVVDTRRFVQHPQGPFANGGDIVYSGRCL